MSAKAAVPWRYSSDSAYKEEVESIKPIERAHLENNVPPSLLPWVVTYLSLGIRLLRKQSKATGTD